MYKNILIYSRRMRDIQKQMYNYKKKNKKKKAITTHK